MYDLDLDFLFRRFEMEMYTLYSFLCLSFHAS
jgi:hypothetical protein